jgi:galactokinase
MNAHERALSVFRRAYGTEPAIVTRAPGRVNLIGEHTDYNDGFVLPLAIDRDTVVAAGPAADGWVEVIACDEDYARDRFDPRAPIVQAKDGWADYARGITKALIEEGVPVTGSRFAIAGDVPLGSGLSSSASLELAFAHAALGLAGVSMDSARLARIAQRAENDFVGCACGIMDQLISSKGAAGHALLIDCRSLACAPIALPADTAVIIAHSGVRHAHAGGAYNDRRAECDAAARHYGVAALRDLGKAALEANRHGLDQVIYRRARHVVTENDRTTAAAKALQAGDLTSLGILMAQSHASMRDDFEITVPAVDRLAAIMAAPLAGNGGARMTGGGFGGCVIAVTQNARVSDVLGAVAARYRSDTGEPADVFVCAASEGAGRI